MRAMSDFFYLPLSQQLFTLKKTELNEKKIKWNLAIFWTGTYRSIGKKCHQTWPTYQVGQLIPYTFNILNIGKYPTPFFRLFHFPWEGIFQSNSPLMYQIYSPRWFTIPLEQTHCQIQAVHVICVGWQIRHKHKARYQSSPNDTPKSVDLDIQVENLWCYL